MSIALIARCNSALADVLSAIICRVRDTTGAVPLVSAYDGRERSWSLPAPLLFQRQVGHENRAITAGEHPRHAHRRARRHRPD
jgi:hypothetical protein